METILILVFIAAAVWISWMISSAAGKKGRSEPGFFWLSLLLFPLGAIIAGYIVAATKPLLPEEKKAFERQKLAQYTPHLGKLMGGSGENRFVYNLDHWREVGAVTQGQAENQLRWQKKVFAKMVELGAISHEKLERALSGDVVEAGRIDQKFKKLKRTSPEFVVYINRIETETTLQGPSASGSGGLGESEASKPQVPSKEPANGDLVARIEKLAALREQGLLSEEEFTEGKKRLLDG